MGEFYKSCSKCGIVNRVKDLEIIGWQVYGEDKFCKCGNQIQFKPNNDRSCLI